MRLQREEDYVPGTTKLEPRPETKEKTKIYLDTDGNLQESLRRTQIVAGIIEDGNSTTYYVRANRAGFFYNPLESYLNNEWGLVGVKEAVFNSYRSFLKTKDSLHLKTAERAYQNG